MAFCGLSLAVCSDKEGHLLKSTWLPWFHGWVSHLINPGHHLWVPPNTSKAEFCSKYSLWEFVYLPFAMLLLHFSGRPTLIEAWATLAGLKLKQLGYPTWCKPSRNYPSLYQVTYLPARVDLVPWSQWQYLRLSFYPSLAPPPPPMSMWNL